MSLIPLLQIFSKIIRSVNWLLFAAGPSLRCADVLAAAAIESVLVTMGFLPNTLVQRGCFSGGVLYEDEPFS